MTVKDIIKHAQLLTGQFISLPVALELINNAVDFLKMRYDTAFTNVIAMEFEAEPDKPYPIEQDYYGITSVMFEGRPYKDYVVIDNNIVFRDKGKFTVYVQPVPIEVTTENDEPDLPMQYHSILKLYVASRMTRPIDRELEQEFWVMAEQINQRLQRRKRKGARIPVGVWR